MSKDRPNLAIGLVVMACAVAALQPAEAQGPPKEGSPQPAGKRLEVTPAGEPRPALAYRLLPMVSERTPGDAAPVYLRLGHEYHSAWPDLSKKPAEWLDLPDDQFPLAEARAFVDQHAARLRLLGFAARRATCDWAYTIAEQRDQIIEVLLPDAQELRTWARLLALKARVEVAEGKTAKAVETIETGLAMARHVAEGPFLINDLVGIAIASSMLDRLEELISRPETPNLYWSLTALPRPFISTRDSLEYEQKLGEWMVPELERLDEPGTPAEWSSLLARLHNRLIRLADKLASFSSSETAQAFGKIDLQALKAELLPKAQEAFPAEGMSDDERLVRYIAQQYQILRDDVYAPAYLAYPDALAMSSQKKNVVEEAKNGGPVLRLMVEIFPVIEAALGAEARLDRRIAALRVVEAIRMQAAQDSNLPRERSSIKVVPVPFDPVTGQPFGYQSEGNAVILSAPPIPGRLSALEYTISLRN